VLHPLLTLHYPSVSCTIPTRNWSIALFCGIIHFLGMRVLHPTLGDEITICSHGLKTTKLDSSKAIEPGIIEGYDKSNEWIIHGCISLLFHPTSTHAWRINQSNESTILVHSINRLQPKQETLLDGDARLVGVFIFLFTTI